jgi:nucleotide-binding universal stress UspA family protein
VKVLLAVDRTKQADEAVHAITGCFAGAEIEVLHVLDIEAVPHSHLSAAMIDSYHQKIRSRLEAEANRFLPNVMAFLLGVTGRVRLLVREGRAAEVILHTASSFHADLIVMGCRRLSRVRAWLLGGVSYRVAQEASCPVLLCKHPLPVTPKILMVCDTTDGTEIMVRFLAAHAVFAPCAVLVLSVNSTSDSGNEDLHNVKERLESRGFTVDTRRISGERVASILGCARDEGIDVIATATRDTRAGGRRWLRGGVWQRVMLQADQSVLIVREPSWAGSAAR